jgi:hypothetical protein
VVSEYERNRKLPNLRTALKLEVIYQTPLTLLFPALHAEISREVEASTKRHPWVRRHQEELSRRALECSVTEMSTRETGHVLSSHPTFH